MKVNEKLAFFSKMAEEEAEQQRAEILAGIEKEMRQAIAAYTLQAEKQAAQRLHNEGQKIDQMKNKEIIHASTEAKKALIDLREKLMNELFQNVTAQLIAYTDTEPYQADLAKKIQAFMIRYPSGQFYLTEKDFKNLSGRSSGRSSEQLPEFLCAKERFIGGFKLFIPEKKAIEDHTYLASLKNARENFALLKLSDNKREAV